VHFSDLGAIAQTLALVFALYAVAGSALGARLDRPALVASGRRALYVVAAFLVTACVSLILSFTTHDFGARYVYEHSSLSMPWQYTTTAFYSGQEGSLLYWATTLSLFAALAVALHGRSPARLMPWVAVVLASILSFLLIALNFVSTPFARTKILPLDGLGLNPLLRDPGMLVHPPLLLLGYMSFSVPFAFAIAALITGELDSGWLRSIRRWTLAAWTIQTTGLLLGAWWAYHVLGWGGYWGWDPVENAALLPWLTATAFLHSTMVQERRGSLKVWNLALIIATFALCIFGTFEVRSGIISSVHSFAYSAIGGVFLGFLATVLISSIGLFVYRLPRLRPEHEFDSVVSREGSFLLNNLLLTGIAFAIFWGTLFPLLSSSFRGQTMTVGADFYQQVNGPLFAILILAMGIGPLLAWRRASWASVWRNFRWPALSAAVVAIALPILGVRDFWAVVGFVICAFSAATILYEVWRGVRVRHAHGENYPQAALMLFNRHRARYGGYLVHMGLIILAVGVIGGRFFQTQQEAQLKRGESMTVAGYTLRFDRAFGESEPGANAIKAQFTLMRDGKTLRQIEAGQRTFDGFPDQPVSIISISTFGLDDVYVFVSSVDGADAASVRVFVNPLTPLVWMGGALMLLGGVLCWWPERRRRPMLIEQPARREREAVTP
jgi:cytochrome c-type biogenesis protein CcmF